MSHRRRALGLLGLALVLGGLAASDVSRREAALARQLEPLVDVVVAQRPLPAGRRLRVEDLGLVRMPQRYAPVDRAEAAELLVGERLAIAVAPRGFVTEGHLDLEVPTVDPVGRGERAVAVVALAEPGSIQPGVRVDVLVTREGEGGEAGRAELALQDVEVLAARPVPSDDGAEDGLPRVAVTLRVRVRQAVYLAAAQSFARAVRLLPRARGDRRRSTALAVGEGLR